MASDKTVTDYLVTLDKFNLPGINNLAIVDLREASEFILGHVNGSANFPITQLIDRMYQLPDNTQPLRLCGDAPQLESAYQKLTAKGYQIKAALLWTKELKAQLISNKLLQSGNSSQRLWSPAKIVELFQKQFVANQSLAKLNKPKALDIGCGAGRDSVYLALNGWQVCSLDYLKDALGKAQSLANQHQVNIRCCQMDIEKSLSEFENWGETFDLVLVVRYLHRPLLALLKDKISSGGFLVYQTFMQGCEKFGSPRNPRFLLAEAELAESFKEFDILIDKVEYLTDGRPTKVFIARKK